MTGASLFNWDYDRRTLQGGTDLFGDSFGKANTTQNNQSAPTDNSNPDTINPDGNVDDTANRDPTNNGFKDYLSTYVFPNSWRTVLRINKRNPMFITHDYVDAMFSGVFGTWPLKVKADPPKQKSRDGCILM
jgi:hypothetical protein